MLYKAWNKHLLFLGLSWQLYFNLAASSMKLGNQIFDSQPWNGTLGKI